MQVSHLLNKNLLFLPTYQPLLLRLWRPRRLPTLLKLSQQTTCLWPQGMKAASFQGHFKDLGSPTSDLPLSFPHVGWRLIHQLLILQLLWILTANWKTKVWWNFYENSSLFIFMKTVLCSSAVVLDSKLFVWYCLYSYAIKINF